MRYGRDPQVETMRWPMTLAGTKARVLTASASTMGTCWHDGCLVWLHTSCMMNAQCVPICWVPLASHVIRGLLQSIPRSVTRRGMHCIEQTRKCSQSSLTEVISRRDQTPSQMLRERERAMHHSRVMPRCGALHAQPPTGAPLSS